MEAGGAEGAGQAAKERASMAQRWLLRLRPERQDHVWAYDFVAIPTRDGNRFVFKDDRSLPGCLQQQLGFFRVSPFYVETL